jgi:hypothetical protein
VGLHVLAASLVERIRAHWERFGATDEAALTRLLGDIGVLLSVAKGPRMARTMRLGQE